MSKKKTITSILLTWCIRLCIIFIVGLIILFLVNKAFTGNGEMQKNGLQLLLTTQPNTKVRIGKLDALYFIPDVIIDFDDAYAVDINDNRLWSVDTVEFKAGISSFIGGEIKLRHLFIKNLELSKVFTKTHDVKFDYISLIPSSNDDGEITAYGKYGNEVLEISISMARFNKKRRTEYFSPENNANIRLKYADIYADANINLANKQGLNITDLALFILSEADKNKKINDLSIKEKNKLATISAGSYNGRRYLEFDIKTDEIEIKTDYLYTKQELIENDDAIDIELDDLAINISKKIDANIIIERIDIDKLSKENNNTSKLVKRLLEIKEELFPTENNNISLPEMEINLNIYAENILYNKSKIGNLSIPVHMNNNSLSINNIEGSLSDGKIEGSFYLIPSENKDHLTYNLSHEFNISDMNLGKLVNNINGKEILQSNADVKLKLKSSGINFDQMHKNMDGDFSFIMANGKLQSSIIDFWGGGLVNALIPDTEHVSDINCVIADFTIEDAAAKSNILLMDTSKITVKGEGNINLLNGDLKFKIEPDSKDTALLDIATAMNITGNISDPNISPDMASVGKKGIGALLGLINPALLLITMTDFGINEDHPCHKHIGTKENSEETK